MKGTQLVNKSKSVSKNIGSKFGTPSTLYVREFSQNLINVAAATTKRTGSRKGETIV